MALFKNKISGYLHSVYHLIESAIAKLFGETIRYKFIYFLRTGNYLNMNNPKDLNEKLFWLSRYWRHPLITKCADKYLVREYLAKKGCGDILNTLYGVYDNADDIIFETLPKKFVLKCNHGCQMNIICEDKDSFDIDSAKSQLNQWLKFQYGRGTEWQYKNIPRKIIVERFLESFKNQMIEYQIFCFNGKPQFFLVRNDLRKSKSDKDIPQYAVSYTTDWHRVYMRKEEEEFKINLAKPKNYQKMLEYASILSADFPQVRVDFYEVDDELIFGELTFSSSGSVLSKYKTEYIIKLGNSLVLPEKLND